MNKIINFKKFFLIFFLINFSFMPVCKANPATSSITGNSINGGTLLGITGFASALFLGVLAYKEYSERNRLQKELDGEDLLSGASAFIKYVDQNYGKLISVLNFERLHENANIFFDFKKNVFRTPIEFENFCKILLKDIEKTSELLSKLNIYEIRLKDKNPNSSKLNFIDQKLVPEITKIDNQLKFIIDICDKNKYLFNLKIALIYYSRKYCKEQKFVEIEDSKKKILRLHRHIITIYGNINPNKFPYIIYAENLKKDLLELQSLIYSVESEQKSNNISEIRQQVKAFLDLFEQVLECVINSEKYEQEIQQKKAFDLEQERIKLATQEKQANLELEKKKVETNLFQERNKAEQLANIARETERRLKELEVEKARILSNKITESALTENNKTWTDKYNKIIADKSLLENNLKKIYALIKLLKDKLSQTKLDDKSVKSQELINLFKDINIRIADLEKATC